MPAKKTRKNYCFKHDRPKVPTGLRCMACLGSHTSPARRKSALNASRAAAKARTAKAQLRKERAKKRGKNKPETFEDAL